MKNLTIVPFLFLIPGCSFFMREPAVNTPAATARAATSEVPAAAATSEALPPATASATPAAPAAKPIKTFSLVEYKLPLSIDMPEDAKLEASSSRDKLGGALLDAPGISLRIVKADARLSSVPTTKATLQKIVRPAKNFYKEEKDLLVYDRGDDDRYFVVITRVAGVTYACQEMGGESSEALLEPGIAACRSLKKAP